MDACPSDSDCSTKLSDFIDDDDHHDECDEPPTKSSRRVRDCYESSGKKPAYTAYCNFDVLKRAIDILNEPKQPKKRKLYCGFKSLDNNVIHHKTTIHYCGLIKHAILKKNWRMATKLLMAYISEDKREKYHEQIILKYTMIILLNDPIAIKNNSIREFFSLGLSCHSTDDGDTLLKMIMNKSNDEDD